VPWAAPEYSKGRVDAAGRALADERFSEEHAVVIGNWRSAHGYPLFALQHNLRNWARKCHSGALISRRLKRLSSISLKLQLNPAMKLSQMQDIGGCRAIVGDPEQVKDLVSRLKRSRAAHQLAREDDYIANPKDSGYRSHHLVFRYHNDNKAEYNGLKIEMQIRTNEQHAWATAVETAGTFTEQALKSSQGSEEWLYFFKLMSADIARRERCPSVPGTPTTARQLRDEIRRYDKMLGVVGHLRGWQVSLRQFPEIASNAQYLLLQLFPEENRLNIRGFRKQQLDDATAEYLKAEENAIAKHIVSDSVLVSVDSLRNLQRAYPNYYSDTSRFIEAIQRAKG
jgi:hypothetical protein